MKYIFAFLSLFMILSCTNESKKDFDIKGNWFFYEKKNDSYNEVYIDSAHFNVCFEYSGKDIYQYAYILLNNTLKLFNNGKESGQFIIDYNSLEKFTTIDLKYGEKQCYRKLGTDNVMSDILKRKISRDKFYEYFWERKELYRKENVN